MIEVKNGSPEDQPQSHISSPLPLLQTPQSIWAEKVEPAVSGDVSACLELIEEIHGPVYDDFFNNLPHARSAADIFIFTSLMAVVSSGLAHHREEPKACNQVAFKLGEALARRGVEHSTIQPILECLQLPRPVEDDRNLVFNSTETFEMRGMAVAHAVGSALKKVYGGVNSDSVIVDVGIGSGAFSTLDFIRVLHRYGSFPHVIGVDVRPEVLASGYLARSVVLKRDQTVKDAISKGADLSFGQADLMAHLKKGEIPSVTDTVKNIAPEKRVIVVNCANLTSQWWLREEMNLYKEGYQSFISICRDDDPVYIESVVSTAEAVNLRQRVVMDVHVRVPSSGTIIPDINIVLGAIEENAVQDVLELNAAVESAMQEAFR